MPVPRSSDGTAATRPSSVRVPTKRNWCSPTCRPQRAHTGRRRRSATRGLRAPRLQRAPASARRLAARLISRGGSAFRPANRQRGVPVPAAPAELRRPEPRPSFVDPLPERAPPVVPHRQLSRDQQAARGHPQAKADHRPPSWRPYVQTGPVRLPACSRDLHQRPDVHTTMCHTTSRDTYASAAPFNTKSQRRRPAVARAKRTFRFSWKRQQCVAGQRHRTESLSAGHPSHVVNAPVRTPVPTVAPMSSPSCYRSSRSRVRSRFGARRRRRRARSMSRCASRRATR